VEQLGYQTQHY